MRNIVAALALIPLWPTAAIAQDKPAAAVASQPRNAGDPLPDPATITVPDVTPPTDPKVRGDGYKFYYFHNPNVTFAQAYDDIAECRAFLAHTSAGPVPGFVPWRVGVERSSARLTDKSPTVGLSPYGVLGDAMGAIMAPKMERGSRSNIMRRCMGTRGYVRYAITESAFDELNDGPDEDRLILMQAKLASGPKPNDEEVTR
ncbi:MAG: hypothetical protein E7773_13275 [Sphingomonas sp.]|uniref:hypothetical protein n=1 Tax=Sphingomonas sp. TaxID=28214 RepID=UPI001222FF86|nr:hypothetical protein [Sphingomonas sp.]THD35403.1 MAG: hypothetical protein E7773_13275 [Sphingomonas sp.]